MALKMMGKKFDSTLVGNFILWYAKNQALIGCLLSEK